MSKNYEHLINKIEVFIRKYYKNQLIKGLLLGLAMLLTFFLLVVTLEYFFHLGKTFREILFYLYISSSVFIFFGFILRPLAGLIRLGKRLSHEEAARIIGAYFPDIKDKLINTLELQKQSRELPEKDLFLLEAAIEQKSKRLSPIPFHSAVQFSINKRYLKYLLPPVLLFLLLWWLMPKMITESSHRIIHYDKEFKEKAPFHFQIENSSLNCLQGEDFTLRVKIIGSTVPENSVIVINNYPFSVSKDSPTSFHYVFKNVISSKQFFFKAGRYKSSVYHLNVQPLPKIIAFTIKVNYPHYLHRKGEIIKNAGDITIPEGSHLQWTFNTKDLSYLQLIFTMDSFKIRANQRRAVSPLISISKSSNYSLIPHNRFITTPDTLSYHIELIKDAYPSIKVEEYKDSLDDKHLYFKGIIKDDHGFSALKFIWFIKNASPKDKYSKSIAIQHDISRQGFYYYVNIDSLRAKEGDDIDFYFEVWDNDGVNGAKAAKTMVQSMHKASKEQLDSARNKIDAHLREQMEQNRREAKKINQQAEKLRKKLINKKELNWQDKQQLKELLQRYQKMMKNIEAIKRTKKLSQHKNNELSKDDKRLMEKQKQLQKLFDKLMTPEMKKMMEEMQKMMEKQMKKEEVEKMLEKIQLNNKDLEKQMDRDLEIFKQMQFAQKLQEAINKLDTIKKSESKLSKELKEKNSDKEKAQQQQRALDEDFKKFEKKIEEAKKANKALEQPNEMQNTQEEQKQIKEQMQQSEQALEKGKKKAASKMQQSASEAMQKLSDKLKQMQSDMESQTNTENMENLRNILSNLIETSFNEENLMKKVQKTRHNDPQYPHLIRRQKEIKMDLRMIEDSLLALSKRQASISPMVNKEISHINLNMDKTMEALLAINTIGPTSLRQKNMAVGMQQQIMTSVNNLALMLSEALEQMQRQQMQSKMGKGKCNKPRPGKSGSSMKSIRQMQQALRNQMKKMQQQMKNGKQKGPKKGKGKRGTGGEKMSEEMARMAAQQELIRQKLQAYQQSLKKMGMGKQARDLNKAVKDMEQNETDMVNSMLLRNSIMRQKEILSRLLEAENAEREQKQEEKREAQEGKNTLRKNPPGIEQFLKQQNKELDMLKTIPPNLKPYYKNKVNHYLEHIKID